MVKLSKYVPKTLFDIKAPRYHDKRVLLKASKVDKGQDYLLVRFSEAPTMEGDWVITRRRAKQYPKESNGVIQCYSLPLNALDILEIDNKPTEGMW